MSGPRFFIGKHPCDDQPYIHDVDPDPRSGDPHFTFDGPDYSGWYVRADAIATLGKIARGEFATSQTIWWCDEHKRQGEHEGGCVAGWRHKGVSYETCRMTEAVVVLRNPGSRPDA